MYSFFDDGCSTADLTYDEIYDDLLDDLGVQEVIMDIDKWAQQGVSWEQIKINVQNDEIELTKRELNALISVSKKNFKQQ